MAPLPGQASAQLLYLLPILLFAIYVAYQRFFSPLAGIPGPFGASLSRLWIVKHSWQGNMHRQMIDLHSKYGKIIRTGPNEVSVADVKALKAIYGSLSHPSSLHLVMFDTELTVNSHQDLARSFARAIGTASSKAIANSTYLRNVMKEFMALKGDWLAGSTLWTPLKILRNTFKMLCIISLPRCTKRKALS